MAWLVAGLRLYPLLQRLEDDNYHWVATTNLLAKIEEKRCLQRAWIPFF